MIDTAQLRKEWPASDHVAATGHTHCQQCHLRMPCDWSLIIADLHAALNWIDERLDMDR